MIEKGIVHLISLAFLSHSIFFQGEQMEPIPKEEVRPRNIQEARTMMIIFIMIVVVDINVIEDWFETKKDPLNLIRPMIYWMEKENQSFLETQFQS